MERTIIETEKSTTGGRGERGRGGVQEPNKYEKESKARHKSKSGPCRGMR